MNQDEAARERGFQDWKELQHLVVEVDLTSEKKRRDFQKWKMGDGTKTGLLALMKEDRCQTCSAPLDSPDLWAITFESDEEMICCTRCLNLMVLPAHIRATTPSAVVTIIRRKR